MKQNFQVAAAVTLGILVIGAESWLLATPRPNPTVGMAAITSPGPVATSTAVPNLGILTVTPTLITVKAHTSVTATLQITDATLIPGSVNLVRLSATGSQASVLGTMQTPGNGTFTLQIPFDESSPGEIVLQASAAFRGQMRRVLSPVVKVAVWGVVADATSGLKALYPPGVFNVTATDSPPDLFVLASSPAGVDIGGGAPEDASSPARTGFEVSLQADIYTVPTFDLDQWLLQQYPNSDVASKTPTTVGGQPACIIQFQNEVGAGQPMAVVYYNGYVYQIAYSSTFGNGSDDDQKGLDAFQAIIQHFAFTR